MHTQDQTKLDFFLPAGDQFVLIVGAICPQVLKRVQVGPGGGTRPADHAEEEETRVTGER
jgi:hypothetical protein